MLATFNSSAIYRTLVEGNANFSIVIVFRYESAKARKKEIQIEAAKQRTQWEPAQVNLSYGIHKQWRRFGLAQHALDLMNEYLRADTNARQIVLRIAPANTASIRIAEKGRFTYMGTFDEPEGPMASYIRDVR